MKRNLPIMNSVSGNPPPAPNRTFPCRLWLSPQTMQGNRPPPSLSLNPTLVQPLSTNWDAASSPGGTPFPAPTGV